MARPRRRHGRGGAPFTGEPNGLQPGDDIGNRRSFKQTQLPPDNIGNRKDPEEEAWVPNDDVGNRIDAAPTHEISGALASIDGRRRRKKGGQPHQRVGRYIVGGVNPVVAGNVQRAVEAMKEADERKQLERMAQRAAAGANASADAGYSAEGAPLDEEGRRGRRRRRRRRDGREQVDGQAAQEVSERRAQRFFDFEEDDRFEYVLKSDPERKRQDAHDAVANVLAGAGRDAEVKSRVLDDDNRPKVIVTIDEKGPAESLPAERRTEASAEPLFVLGNAALMSLNYLVNKIVNRYPDDRIRLAILPAADEQLYLESLAEHRRMKRAEAEGAKTEGPKEAGSPKNGAAGPAEPVAQTPAEEPAAEAAPGAPAAEEPAAETAPEAPAAEERPAAAIAEEPPVAEKPKRTRTTKKLATRKAAAAVDESAAEEPAADAAGSDEGAAEEASEDTTGRKATKKRASAKVSTRSRTTSDREEAAGAKKASAKKATAKKATAKKSASKKKASSEE